MTVLYFAGLREAAGLSEEQLELPESLPALYAVLSERHGFTHGQSQLRVACNGAFCDWQRTPMNGDVIAFIPPVSGG